MRSTQAWRRRLIIIEAAAAVQAGRAAAAGVERRRSYIWRTADVTDDMKQHGCWSIKQKNLVLLYTSRRENCEARPATDG